MSSDDDIEEWSRPCDDLSPWWTRSVVGDALSGARRLQDRSYEVFTQGSYANGTNIRGSSDIDLVIQLSMPFEEQIDALDAGQRDRFHERYRATLYGWEEFREDVLATLRERYFVHEGNKCVDIRDWDSLVRVPADVLPAIEYRYYTGFSATGAELYEEGVLFRDSHGTEIMNFPKQHLVNGRRKDRATGGRFKQVVRAVKNARKHVAGDGAEAPSYFVECLLHNVPDAQFRVSAARAFHQCIDWLGERDEPQLARFRCQNGLVPLFGDGADRWTTGAARTLVTSLAAAPGRSDR